MPIAANPITARFVLPLHDLFVIQLRQPQNKEATYATQQERITRLEKQ